MTVSRTARLFKNIKLFGIKISVAEKQFLRVQVRFRLESFISGKGLGAQAIFFEPVFELVELADEIGTNSDVGNFDVNELNSFKEGSSKSENFGMNCKAILFHEICNDKRRGSVVSGHGVNKNALSNIKSFINKSIGFVENFIAKIKHLDRMKAERKRRNGCFAFGPINGEVEDPNSISFIGEIAASAIDNPGDFACNNELQILEENWGNERKKCT